MYIVEYAGNSAYNDKKMKEVDHLHFPEKTFHTIITFPVTCQKPWLLSFPSIWYSPLYKPSEV